MKYKKKSLNQESSWAVLLSDIEEQIWETRQKTQEDCLHTWILISMNWET